MTGHTSLTSLFALKEHVEVNQEQDLTVLGALQSNMVSALKSIKPKQTRQKTGRAKGYNMQAE